MSTYAVIPVKGTSERVQSKNFRPFVDGMSLTELKVRQTVESGVFRDVFISSDSDEGETLAARHGVTFLRRDAAFCNNQVPWSDVIYHVVNSLPIDPTDTVCWSHSTSPLFWRFADAVQQFNAAIAEGYDSLIGVAALNEYILTDKGRPVNYAWGVWHPYTQHVEKLLRVTGSVFIAPKSEMLRCRYIVGQRPYLYATLPFEAVDVDTDYDFRLAQLLYRNRAEFAPPRDAYAVEASAMAVADRRPLPIQPAPAT
jgi:CMP-N-acetylneuraminic acid synthetase